MKHFLIYLLIALSGIKGWSQNNNTCQTQLLLDLVPGKSSRIDANTPIDFSQHFKLDGLPQGVTSQNIIWYISRNQISNDRAMNATTASNFSFASSGFADEWGQLWVKAAYRCPSGPLNGRLIESNFFRIEVLNYGIWFYGDTEVRPFKHFQGQANPYFDVNKPTVIFVHGWNKESATSHKREKLLNNNNVYMIKAWRDSGYNVGIFYWNQFSDFTSLSDVENKIYGETAKDWRREGPGIIGETGNFMAPPASMAQLFRESYVNVRNQLASGVPIRVVGHSLGGQVAVMGLDKITNTALLPTRLTLLDPWWSGGKQPGMLSAMTKFKNGNMAMEYFSTNSRESINNANTKIQNAYNLSPRRYNLLLTQECAQVVELAQYSDILTTTVYTAISPEYAQVTPFNPLIDFTTENNASIWWYFNSRSGAKPEIVVAPEVAELHTDDHDLETEVYKAKVKVTGRKAPSSQDCDDYIKSLRGLRLLHVQGATTLGAFDDLFFQYQAADPNEIMMTIPYPFPGSVRAKARSVVASRRNHADYTTIIPPDAGGQKVTRLGMELNSPESYFNNYSCQLKIPTVTGWHLSQTWRGPLKGRKTFKVSTANCTPKVKPEDYDCSLFDRGHMVPSEDRNKIELEKSDTYFMDNIVPMNPQLNQRKAWRSLERYVTNVLVGKTVGGELRNMNLEVFQFSGGLSLPGLPATNGIGAPASSIQSGSTIIAVPNFLWKVIAIHVPGQPDDLEHTNMIAVLIPNRHDASKNWQEYITTVDAIEGLTGKNFFDKLPDNVENILESRQFDYRSITASDNYYGPGTSGEASACQSLNLSEGFMASAGSRFRGYIDAAPCVVAKTKPQEIPEAINTNFRVMPNPASTRATVSYTDNQLKTPAKAVLHLVDINGRVLINQPVIVQIGANFYPIDMSRMGAGVYIVRLQTDKGKIWTSKLVKQ